MDKQKQIEEMAKVIESVKLYGIDNYGRKISHDSVLELAKYLVEQGYRKIPEGSVVLSKEELYYNGYRKVCKPAIKNGEVVGFVNGADYVPKNLFLFAISQARKETAEEFAEKLENGIDNLDIILHEDNDEQYVSINQLLKYMDEIAKQFGVEVEE